MDKISSFKEQWSFLSNFYPLDRPIVTQSIKYYSVETAYPAYKTLDLDQRRIISKLSPAQSKKYARTIQLRDDWEQVKVEKMFSLLLGHLLMNVRLVYRKLPKTFDIDI